MKPSRTTTVIVIVFIALAAYVLLVEMKREPPQEEDPTPTPIPLLGLDINDVQSLQINDRDRVLQITHKELEWRIHAEDREPSGQDGSLADPFVVHLAIDDLTRLTAQRALLDKVSEWDQYGLEPASLVLQISTYSDQHQEIHVGKLTLDNAAYYVRLPGDPRLYLVNQYTLQPFFEWLNAPPYQPTPTPGPA